MADLKQIRVFISSPGDVMPEREIIERVVARLDGIWKSYVRLSALNWVREHYEAIRGFQELIGEMTAFDIVLGVLWKRLGSPLRPDMFKRDDGTPYESGTVFEIELAIASSTSLGKPAVFLFRKSAAVSYTAENFDDERRQHQALQNWWNRTVRDDQGHFLRGYQSFETLDELEHSVENLLDRLLRDRGLIPAGPAWDIETKKSPYPGLLPYDRAYSDVFFGRALSIASAMDDLRAAADRGLPALFVVGPSGSGKSSLLRAGLLPHFMPHQIEGIDFWRQVLIEPAQDPYLLFAQRLYGEAALPELLTSPNATPESFASLARQSPENAAQAVKWALDRAAHAQQAVIGGGRVPVGRLLVSLDQLETVLDGDQRHEFTRFVRCLVESETTWLIATLRSDRYPDLQLDPNLLELRRRGAMYDLPPPGPSEIADIIKGPARAANLVFDERPIAAVINAPLQTADLDGRGQMESLASVINADVSGGDALPLLQMTLARLFEAREERTLTFKAYETMGGLEGAIAAHAELVFATVSSAGQATLDALLRSLVADIEENGRLTIKTPSYASVAHDQGSRDLVDKLTAARLIVNAEGGVRIAHEALLRRWQRATASPALQPEAIRLRRQIEPSFEVWNKTRLKNDLLQPGTTAIAAAEMIVKKHRGAYPPELESYIESSVQAAQSETRRARRRTMVAMGAAAAFAGLAVFAFFVYGRAQDNFSLALLTKAEQSLRDDKPARALVEASAAIEPNLASSILQRFGLSGSMLDKDVRAGAIAAIAGPASQVPVRTLMLPDEADAVAFSPDGARIAVGDANGEIVVVGTRDGDVELRLTGHAGPVTSVKFSPDGKWIASASYDRTIRLWDTASKQAKVLCGHLGRTNEVAFDPSGRFLASGSNDGHVMVWDMTTFAAVGNFNDGKAGSWALAVDFSPDGSLLAASYDNGEVFIRKTQDWSATRIATNRKDLVGVSFSPDGKRIATASIEGALDVWDSATGAVVAQITDHPNKLWKVRFSPDGRLLAAASWDGAARIWDGQTFRYLGTIDGNDHWITDIAFSADSLLLATADEAGATRVWKTDSIAPMFYTARDDDRETLTGTYSPDGSMFVAGGRDHYARLYRVNQRGEFEFQCRVAHDDWVIAVAFLPDGKSVVSAGTSDGKADNVIKIWSASDCGREREQAVPVGAAFVDSIAASPDGKWLAWGSREGAVWLVELGPQAKQSKLPAHHSGPVYALAFSPDGSRLVSAGQDKTIAVWSTADRILVRDLSGHRELVEAIKFAPDGHLLVSTGADGLILLWDINAQVPLVKTLSLRGGAGTLAFSPDGGLLAAGSDTQIIAMWTLPSFEKIFELDALVGVRGVFGFDPKRGDLAFDGEDGLIRIFPKASRPQRSSQTMDSVLQGTDVFFDRMAGYLAQGDADQVIKSNGGVCKPP